MTDELAIRKETMRSLRALVAAQEDADLLRVLECVIICAACGIHARIDGDTAIGVLADAALTVLRNMHDGIDKPPAGELH